jgi:hypothetical protein
MPLRDAYQRGAQDALLRFKIANLTAGAAAYNPTLNSAQTSAMGTPSMPPKPPVPPSAPVAAGAAKSSILG